MLSLALVAGLALAVTPDRPPDAALAAYEKLKAGAGTGAAEQVRLALWCESRGLLAERARHLALAVLKDPNNVTARGLLGLVSDGQGRWRAPDAIALGADSEAPAALAEYQERRGRSPDTAEAHWKLALWCEQSGLKAEAVAHLSAVTRLEPARSAAWKRLGYQPHAGRWATPEQIAEETAEARAQAKADRAWRPRLERLKGYLTYHDPVRRAEARSAILAVSDPRAVPAILAVFGTGDTRSQLLAVQALAGINAPASSRALADLALAARSDAVWRAATEALRGRDPREFVDRLIAHLQEPVRYRVKPVGRPGEAGEIVIAGDRFDLDRVYEPAPSIEGLLVPPGPEGPRPTWLFNDNGVLRRQPGDETLARMNQEIEKDAYELRGQQKDDVGVLERESATVVKANDRTVQSLVAVLGTSKGSRKSDWDRWWNDRRGYSLASRATAAKPTVYERVTPNSSPAPVDNFVYDRGTGSYVQQTCECFAAGTPVRTLRGVRPIEEICLGDQVLTQNPATGALCYQPVLIAHASPPTETYRLDLGSETVRTTGLQGFWKAREGWVMARDLKPGDEVRTLAGVARVVRLNAEPAVPVYNLDVAGAHDFFIGTAGTLVHDHTLVEPSHRPFDGEMPAPEGSKP